THSLFHTFLFFTDPPTSEFSTLSLHDALPIWSFRLSAARDPRWRRGMRDRGSPAAPCDRSRRGIPRASVWFRDRGIPRRERSHRSEEHTSELQSRFDLVCRLLLEKKKQS